MKVSELSLLTIFGLQLMMMFLILDSPTTQVTAQEGGFELPVQIVGFPVIILAVRLSNFIRKLTYSLSPSTYRSRTKRGALAYGQEEQLDVTEAEKRLVAELGQGVCIYERVCAHYAQVRRDKRSGGHIDWATVLSQYKHSPDHAKEFYLLSVFLGNIVGSPQLCHQLAKRGRACPPIGSWEQ